MARKKKSAGTHSEPAPPSESPEQPPLYLETANPPRQNKPILIAATLLASFWIAFLITLAWYSGKG
ncbi:MAG: hypothetical protein WDZ51_18090 [Pirellulaceae bacterium]